MGGNEALSVNDVVGRQADIEITTRGSDWYFTVCAIMGLTTLLIMGFSFRKAQTERVFHYITAGITAVACIAYFSMGSNLGQVPIDAEFQRPLRAMAGTREIFYARYIDWVITTPLLLLDLLLTAGVPTHTILATLLADEIMIVTGLVGALTRTTYKWGFWTFGMAAFFFVVYELLWDARRHANHLGGYPLEAYRTCGVYLVFIWFLYPIAWGLSEGGNMIHPDSEAVFYGILDILAKPVFGGILLLQHRDILAADLGLNFARRARSGLTTGAVGAHHEKHATAVPGTGAGAGVGVGEVNPAAPVGAGVHDSATAVHPEGPGPNVTTDPIATGGTTGQSVA